MARNVQQVHIGKGGRPRRNRFGPTVITVLFLVLLAVMAPMLAKYRNAPQTWVAKLEAMSRSQKRAPTQDMKHDVWVNSRSGLYYCHDSEFYGRMHPGARMRQESALLKGFRPAGGEDCP